MRTTHIQTIIRSALDIAERCEQPGVVTEVDVLTAINRLQHAAQELEAERLEHFHGVPNL